MDIFLYLINKEIFTTEYLGVKNASIGLHNFPGRMYIVHMVIVKWTPN